MDAKTNEGLHAAREDWLELETAEAIVDGLCRKYPNDPGLAGARKQLRELIAKAEARHTDAAIRRSQEQAETGGQVHAAL